MDNQFLKQVSSIKKALLIISLLLLVVGLWVSLGSRQVEQPLEVASLMPLELLEPHGELVGYEVDPREVEANVLAASPGITVVVNDSADGVDVNPGDGQCATAAGSCTLRAAIQETNALDGDDFIDLRADFYTITIDGPDEDQSATGDFDIVDNLQIQGAGETSTVVDGAQLDRIFHIIGPFDVHIEGVTLRHGQTMAGEDGGALFNSSNANTTLYDSIVRDNQASQWGGGIANSDSAQIDLVNVSVFNNQAGLLGGGIDNHDGIVTLNNSEVFSNIAASNSGGGIYNDGTLRVYNSTIANNQAAIDGGGIFNFDSLTVERSTISYNEAISDAGGILNYGDLVLRNATISNNEAGVDTGGIFNLGTMDVLHATIYQNQAGNVAGGIFNDGFATIENTIVAANVGGNCLLWHTTRSEGHNIEGTDSCAFDSTGDLVNTDPLLGPLQENRAATETHEPLAGSPAIDAIDPNSAFCLTVDQRGVPRPQGNDCDIGAHEYNFVNLAISKSDSPDPVYAGQPLAYELTVSNVGDSEAFGVIVTDTLPAGTSFVSASGDGWTCSHTAPVPEPVVVTCERPLVIIGSAPTLIITVLAPDEGGDITNSAEVASQIADINPANNTSSATTTVLPAADLIISGTGISTTIEIGDPLTFTLNVDNLGPSTATNVVVTAEIMPSEVSYQSATGEGWSCAYDSGFITCTRPSLPVGSAPPITGRAIALVGDETIESSLEVDSTSTDLNPANNNTVVIMGDTFTPRADLSVGILDTPEPVGAGETLLYTLAANNTGPSEATNVILTNQLPPEVSFVSAAGNGWSCSHNAGTVTCTTPNMPFAVASTVFITVTAPSEPTTLTDQASIESETEDQNPSNNSSQEKSTVSALSDLSLNLSDSPDPVDIGETLQYTLTVINQGPSTAEAIVVTDTLPAQALFISVAGSGWTCGMNNGIVNCNRPSLAVGSAPHIFINVSVLDPAGNSFISNSASVRSEIDDLDLSNNTERENTNIAITDLSLSISDSPDPVNAEAILSYLLHVHNTGSVPAASVTVTDTLPAGSSFISASGTGWDCSYAGGLVTCSRESVSVGTAPDIILTVQAPSEGGTITSQVGVSSATADSNLLNNSASESSEVTSIADLYFTVTGDATPLEPGNSLSYIVEVGNLGPSSASAISLTQQLPPEVSYQSITQTGWQCEHDSGTISCGRATLGVGSSSQIEVIVQAVVTSTSVTVPILVEAETGDPNTANNQASALLGSDDKTDLSINLSDSLDPVDAETQFDYLLTIHNAGPAPANSITVTHHLPSDAIFVAASGTGWNCSQSVGIVTCLGDTLAVGSAPEITISVMAPSEGGVLPTDAQIDSAIPDINPNNNEASDFTTITAIANLALDITNVADNNPNIIYTLRAMNNGPSTAETIVMSHTWPIGFTYNQAQGSGWQCIYDSVLELLRCTRDNMVDGAIYDVNVTLSDLTGGNGSGLLEAELRSDVVDRDLSNNLAQYDIEEEPEPTPTPTATPTQSATFTPSPIISTSATPSATPTETPSQSSTPTPTLTHSPTATSTGSVTLTPTATPTEEVTLSATPTLTPSMTPTEGATSTPTRTEVPMADLALNVTDNPSPIYLGQPLTYTIRVTNNGPTAAAAVELNNALSSQVTFVTVSGDDWSCQYNESDHDVSCTRNMLPVGAASDMTLVVTAPDESGSITNNAIVTSDTPDSDNSNNTTVTLTDVTLMADLSLSQNQTAAVLYAADPFSYTLIVDNAGPAPATSVTLSNTLPADVTYLSSSAPNGWTCTQQNNTVTCTNAQLEVGRSSLTINVLAPDEGGLLTNNATVSATQVDLDPSNNRSTSELNITPMADLSLHITSDSQANGDTYTLTYTLNIHNDGPSSANNLTVQGELPSGVTITNITGDGWNCSQQETDSAITITCHRDTLAPDSTSTITIPLDVPADMSVDYTASVSADTSDVDLDDTQDSASNGPPSNKIYLPIIER